MGRLLRGIFGGMFIAVLLASLGCAPASTPSPTAAAAKPAAATAAARPAETVLPIEGGAAKAEDGQATKTGAGADWKTEWDKIVAAANQEGMVAVAGGLGEPFRNGALAFEKAYPGIRLQFEGVYGPDFAPRILAERDAGKYLWDVHIGGTSTMLNELRPKGALEPIRQALILPEVVDGSKWLGGFDDPWMDKDHQWIWAFEGRLRSIAYVNRVMVLEAELNSVEQLLEPRWRGKMVFQDPRLAGPAAGPSGYLLKAKGEDWLRKLYSQEPVVIKDTRQATELVAHDTYPIGVFLDPVQVEFFVAQGMASRLQPVEIESAAGAQITSGFGNITLISKAPHPNAAKVFLNWTLSQEGQRAYVEATNLNSRRLDVPGPAATAPDPKLKYLDALKEEYKPDMQRAQNLAKELLK